MRFEVRLDVKENLFGFFYVGASFNFHLDLDKIAKFFTFHLWFRTERKKIDEQVSNYWPGRNLLRTNLDNGLVI